MGTSGRQDLTPDRPARLAVVFTHPTQHHSPLWRALAAVPGLEVTVFYLSRHGQVPSDLGGLGRDLVWDVDLTGGYRAVFLPSWRGRMADGLGRGLFNPGLVRHLTRDRFDLVWVPGFNTLSYVAAMVLGRLRGIPIVSQCDSTYLTHRGHARRVLHAVCYPFLLNLPSAWIAVGDHNRIYLRGHGVPDDKIVDGPYPLDVDRFRKTVAERRPRVEELRRSLRHRPDAVLFGFVGKYIDRKRPFDFIEAVGGARAQDARVEGVMIGGGPLEARIDRRLGEGDSGVRNLGFVNQEVLPLYYAAVDVLVVCSDSDAHPLVVSEAMAVGTPVILSDRCGNWGWSDVHRPGANGLVYRAGDVDALAAAMRRFAGDREFRDRCAEHAFGTAAGQDLSATVSAVRAIVERLVRRRDG